MSIGLRPLFERVIVELEESKSTTAGGIMLPNDAQEMPARAKVIAIGPNAIEGEKNKFEVGDTLIIMKFSGLNINHRGKEYKIIMKNDIFCVVDDSV